MSPYPFMAMLSSGSPRYEERRRVFGAAEVPIISPIPRAAQLSIGIRQVYVVALPALAADVRERLASHLASKFGETVEAARGILASEGPADLGRRCSRRHRHAVRLMDYYPNYAPKDRRRFDMMDRALRDAAELGKPSYEVIMRAYVFDLEYDRQDLLVVTGRIERERGWR